MGIFKRANNIYITVRDTYTSIGGTSYEEAEEVIIEATNGDLELVSQKKVVMQGLGKGKGDDKNNKTQLLVTKVEGKNSANPYEKVTYKVTKYNQDKVSENDKKRIQWAMKIDGEKQLLKEKGDTLELTMKEEWTGKEIIVMPFLKKATEKVSVKVKVLEETLSLYFNGKFLIFKVIEKDKILKFSYKAVSGRALKNGKFDYSKERQKMKSEGPLPEGEYYINPQEIQYSENRTKIDKLKGSIGRGTMPGGEYSWGKGRIWIKPSEVYIDGILRNNFSIHGGREEGSAGCIDLTNNDVDFFRKIEQYRKESTKIKLFVKY